MLSVNPKTQEIQITRGDTLRVTFGATKNGQPYAFANGDKLKFYLNIPNAKVGSAPKLSIDIPTATGELYISSEQTKELITTDYLYDIELTKANGDVDTIINRKSFKVLGEVG